MELITALLTVVLTWLFLFHLSAGARARARKQAGDLLLRWKPLKLRTLLLFVLPATAVIFLIAGLLFVQQMLADSILAIPHFIAVGQLALAPWFFAASLELRERGIVWTARWTAAFIPWRLIQYCKWTMHRGKLQVQLHQMMLEYHVPDNLADSAEGVLRRFVEFRDAEGKVLNPALERDEASAVVGNQDQPEVHRLQFDLRTLLLFMVVASSACSWFGIRYRRTSQEAGALGQLNAFQPSITRFGREFNIDFSASPSKPRDQDLALLPRLTGLERLNLAGAPITDAGLAEIGKVSRLQFLVLSQTPITDSGLAHLEHLNRLKYLSLWGTEVTEEGVRKLQAALPDCKIDR